MVEGKPECRSSEYFRRRLYTAHKQILSNLKMRLLLRVLHIIWVGESQLSLASVTVHSRAVLNTDAAGRFCDIAAGRIGIAVGE